jgi:hypothetical protein
MSRTSIITFLVSLTDGSTATACLDGTNSIVLRELVLAEFMHLSIGIPELPSTSIGTGIYETREQLLRILDRLDGRPNMRPGRSKMLIGEVRLTMGEKEVIVCAARKALNLTDKELLKRMRLNGNTLSAAIRRECLQRILNYTDPKKVQAGEPGASAAPV